MVSIPIEQCTIDEFLEIVGETPQPDGLHIYIQKGLIPDIPIHHPHRSDMPMFCMVLDGELRLKIDLKDYVIRSNEFIFITPNAIRQFMYISPDLKIACFCFTVEFILETEIAKNAIDPSAYLSTKQTPHIRLQPHETEALAELIYMVYQRHTTPQNEPYQKERLRFSFSLLMYEIMAHFRRQYKDMSLKLTRKEEISAQFLTLLPMHFREQRSLQFYADKLFITPKYLTQTIKETMGKTAGDFIDEMVITEAKVLLQNSNHPIAHIAEALYFSDQFFFSKFFKNQTGLTPTDFRKAL